MLCVCVCVGLHRSLEELHAASNELQSLKVGQYAQ